MAIVGGPLKGTSSNDFLIGDAWDFGATGIDNYSNSGQTALKGFGGNDIIVGDIYDPLGYNTEGDEIYGGDGDDIIYADTAPDLSAYGIVSSFVGDPLWNSRIEGSGDKVYGGAGNDTIYGGGGSDLLYGGTGNDLLYGQQGDDWLEGDQGSDSIFGGAGNDTVYAGAGADIVYGGAGNDNLYGEAFSSSAGDGGDTIWGGLGDDDIRGGAGADKLYGEGGNDRITGGGLWSDASNDLGDLCDGGAGNDVIDGRYGNDVIIGGAGKDELTGGQGHDRFVYRAVSDSSGANIDTITDFEANAMDRIDLSAIDAIPGGADNQFTFRGSQAFTGAGQIRVVTDQTNYVTWIKINTDTDATAEMVIKLNGIKTLDAADFIL